MKTSDTKRSKQRLRHLKQDRQRRIRLLIAKGTITQDSDIPEDSIPIDPECSTKAMTWSPEAYYQDIEFECSDCGKHALWTAESQQYYFEVIRASPYKHAKRCYDCRQKEILRRDKARVDAGHGTQEAEQAVAPNRSLPPTLKSTSSVRGSED